MATKLHAGTHHRQGTLMNRGTRQRASPYHHGSGKPTGVTHAPPPPGGAVNRGGTFGMGRLKRK